MKIEFGQNKSEANVAAGRPPFALVAEFDFDTALVAEDTREAYGEDRFIALGYVRDRLHVVVYTKRGTALRVISFRKANAREGNRYDEASE